MITPRSEYSTKSDFFQGRALSSAARAGHIGVVKYLVDKGAEAAASKTLQIINRSNT